MFNAPSALLVARAVSGERPARATVVATVAGEAGATRDSHRAAARVPGALGARESTLWALPRRPAEAR